MLSITTSGISTEEIGPEPSIKEECDHKDSVYPTREHHVCHKCGEVMNEILLLSHVNPKKKSSKPYCPSHHFSERMAQLTGTGPKVDDAFLMAKLRDAINRPDLFVPKEKLGPDGFSTLIKEIDAECFTDFHLKKYQERWIWLRHALDIEKLPNVSDELLHHLNIRYEMVHSAFRYLVSNFSKLPKGVFKNRRKNIININFVVLNCLKQENAQKLYRFFAMVKGEKTNMADLRSYWIAIKTIMTDIWKNKFYKSYTEIYDITWDKPDITDEEINESTFYIYLIWHFFQ